MSEIRTNILISGESLEYRSNIEISIVTLNSTLVDTHSSFRTTLDISTKDNTGNVNAIRTTLELNNVELKFYLVDMTKLNQSILYFSKFFNMDFEPEVMWDLLSQGTKEQINITHLTEALSNYITNADITTITSSINILSNNLNTHIKDDNRHFTEKEKKFLLSLLENPNILGSGDSLFEKISITENNVAIPAVKPLRQDNKEVGIISNTFISCRGIDNSASSSSSLTRNDLFSILSGPPQEGEKINLQYLIGLGDLIDSLGYIKSINKNQVIAALGYIPLAKDNFKDFDAVSNIIKQDVDNWNFVFSLIGLSEDKTYIFPKEDRGIISNSFISCKGLDISAAQVGSGISGDDFSILLFNILTGTPGEGQFINLAFLDLSSYAQKDWINLTFATKTSLEEKAAKTITLTAGNGLTGGGTLESNRTFALGTPSKITSKTTNAVTSESHTHEIDQASTSVVGIVKLYDALDSDSTILALTAKQGKAIGTRVVALEDMWENKDTYLLAKNNRGIVSNSFISCRGLDETAPQAGGTFDRGSLFDILSGEPQNGESINLGYLDLSNYATTDFVVTQGYITANYLTGYATEQWVKQQGYLTQHQDLSAYAKSADVANTYATKVALQTLQNEHNALSTKVTNLDNLLNSDVSGVINTWGEVVDFLNEYNGSQDLATILAGMNNDIANRVLYTDFEKLEDAVNGIAGYFTNGSANNALKLGGQLPSYYATVDALNLVKNDVTAVSNRVQKFEDVIGIDANGDVYIKGTRNFYTAGGTIGMAGLGSGGSGGGGAAGIVTIRVNGEDYSSTNGLVILPDYPSLSGYAEESWVLGKGYLTSHQDISHLLSKTDAANTYQPKGNYLTAVPSEYITESELSTELDKKQNTISDLTTIREGAAKGATALQSIPSEYITESELANEGFLKSVSWTDVKGRPTKVSEFTNDENYITDTQASSTYATITALEGVNTSVNTLRTEFDALNTLLNDDTSGKIDTWNEVVAFLNGYAESTDLATILAEMNADISKRAFQTDLNAAVNRIAVIENNYVDKSSIETITGVKTFSNGLKIGDAELVWDDTNKALKIIGSAYVTEAFSMGKIPESGGGGGGAAGIVTVRVNGYDYNSVNGIVTLPDYPSLAGYATEDYVTTRGYITASALNGYATEDWVNNKGYITSSALNGYATETYVTTRGYITSSALSGYATEKWVADKGYLTAHQDISHLLSKTEAANIYQPKGNYLTSVSWDDVDLKPAFAKVATSGKYSDLSGLPTIPTNNNQLANGAGYITGITSAMVTNALGYTPYNSSNPSGYITSSALSGYATESWVGANYQPKGNYLTSVSWGDVSSKPTTLAGYGISDAFFLHTTSIYLGVRFANGEYATGDKYLEWWNSAGWVNHMSAKYIVAGATSSHFLKGDGSLDNTAYLPLSGGTISGALTLQNSIVVSSGADIKLVLNNTDTESKYQFISFMQEYLEYGKLGTAGTDDLRWNNNIVLHSGNYSSYALPKSGGTISNSNWGSQLTLNGDGTDAGLKFTNSGNFRGLLYTNNDGRLGWYDMSGADHAIIHSGNIGSYAFIPRADNLISNVNADHYWSNGAYLNQTGNGSGNSNFPNNYAMFLSFNNGVSKYVTQFNMGRGAAYYRTKIDSWSRWYQFITDENIGSQSVNYASSASNASYASSAGSTNMVGVSSFDSFRAYSLYSWHDWGNGVNSYTNFSFGISVNSPDSNHKAVIGFDTFSSNVYVKVKQGYDNWLNWKTIAFTDSNVASATKLQTARTIWGQSFDGTGDVDGAFKYGYINLETGNEINSKDTNGTGVALCLNRQGSGCVIMTVGGGNVLIGTSYDNGAKLQVNGGVTTYGSINMQSVGEIQNALAISRYDNGTGYYVGSRNAGLGVADGGCLVYAYGSTPISFYTYGSERMRINGGGNVLIGTTTDWGFNLASLAMGGNKISGYLGSGGGVFFGNIAEGYGTAIWTQGNGNGYIQQGRSNGAAVNYNLVMQHLGGNVLIGTTYDNGHKLQVDGYITTTLGILGMSASTYNRWNITHGSDTLYFQSGLTDGSGTKGKVLISGVNTHDLTSFGVNATVSTFNGNLTVSGGATFGGDVYSEGTIAMARLTSSSDAKLKENIKWLSADRAIGVVRALRPTEWDWKKDHTHSFGFIAQDVQPIIPEMVSSVNDTLRLEYNQLHAFEIGAIKHIDSEVEILKRRVTELENELKQYRRNA